MARSDELLIRDFIEALQEEGHEPDAKATCRLCFVSARVIEALTRSNDEPTEAMIEAGIQALRELYRGDGGFIGNEAAREQVMRTWNAMRDAS